jgi:hypothetical protein
VADEESRLIYDIASTHGEKVNVTLFKDFSADMLSGRNAFLWEEEHRAIAAFAKAGNYQRVIIVELGTLNEVKRKIYSEAGIELVHLDHHDEEYHKLSSAEQFMRLIGYTASLPEWLTAVKDRSSVYGVAELIDHLYQDRKGAVAKKVKESLNGKVYEDGEWLWRRNPHLIDNGPAVVDISGTPHKPTGFAFNLEMASLPNRINIFHEDPESKQIRFWGEPEIVNAIREEFKDSGFRVFFGGDLVRRGYFILRVKNGEYPLVAERTKRILQNHPSLQGQCWYHITDFNESAVDAN